MHPRSSVVAAIDFSSASIDAARWAAKWLLTNRDLVLAHALVVPQGRGFLGGTNTVADSLLSNARVGAQRRLSRVRRLLNVPAARIEIGEGKPAAVIADIARRENADLIVTGKHGEGGPLRGYTGRTADSLIRSAPVPIFVVNGDSASAPKKLIVALTYSSVTSHVVEWTRRIHQASGARVVIVHVVGSATLSHVLSMSAIQSGEPPSEEQISEIFSDDRNRWTKLLVDAGIPEDSIESEVIFGEVSRAIIGAQASRRADMIIMGSHAGPVRRLLLGSAASAVIRDAEIPVMVVVEPAEINDEPEPKARAMAGAGEFK
jgi:nucleotide-binding universal stress UspA family protein